MQDMDSTDITRKMSGRLIVVVAVTHIGDLFPLVGAEHCLGYFGCLCVEKGKGP